MEEIAWFLAAFVLGGALAQYPVGWLADRYDRRHVLIGLSFAAVLSCAFSAFSQAVGPNGVMIGAFLFGLTSFPIFSISAAHANDFADNSQRVELSAAIMFFYALGAIAAPLLASYLITLFGPAAMFAMIAAGHLLLVFFSVVRMKVRKTRETRTPYIWSPRTSFTLGRLTTRLRDKR